MAPHWLGSAQKIRLRKLAVHILEVFKEKKLRWSDGKSVTSARGDLGGKLAVLGTARQVHGHELHGLLSAGMLVRLKLRHLLRVSVLINWTIGRDLLHDLLPYIATSTP